MTKNCIKCNAPLSPAAEVANPKDLECVKCSAEFSRQASDEEAEFDLLNPPPGITFEEAPGGWILGMHRSYQPVWLVLRIAAVKCVALPAFLYVGTRSLQTSLLATTGFLLMDAIFIVLYVYFHSSIYYQSQAGNAAMCTGLWPLRRKRCFTEKDVQSIELYGRTEVQDGRKVQQYGVVIVTSGHRHDSGDSYSRRQAEFTGQALQILMKTELEIRSDEQTRLAKEDDREDPVDFLAKKNDTRA